jgi:hypothetical protein
MTENITAVQLVEQMHRTQKAIEARDEAWREIRHLQEKLDQAKLDYEILEWDADDEQAAEGRMRAQIFAEAGLT